MTKGFSSHKCKVQLKLGLNRLKLMQQKKSGINSQQKREIASLLETGKEDSARIRVEHIIREDFNIEALEILELYCELILARFGLLEESVHCDPAISEAVCTIIFAAHRSGIKELTDVRDQLLIKFGQDFGRSAMAPNDQVNVRIVQKLKVQTPEPRLVDQYLLAIAETFKINWSPPISVVSGEFSTQTDIDIDSPSPALVQQIPVVPAAPSGLVGSVQVLPTGFPPMATFSGPTFIAHPPSSQQQQQTPLHGGSGEVLPSVPGLSSSSKVMGSAAMAPPPPMDTSMNDFEDLQKRFDMLKK